MSDNTLDVIIEQLQNNVIKLSKIEEKPIRGMELPELPGIYMLYFEELCVKTVFCVKTLDFV